MLVIGSDHGGYELKNKLKDYLINKGIEVVDCGIFHDEAVDYPDIAKDVCKKVLVENADFGILVCGTGIGINIAANKVKGIRAALLCNTFSAQMAREHNNANVICFGGRTTKLEHAIEMLEAYMNAEFLGDRHQVRVDKIMSIEE